MFRATIAPTLTGGPPTIADLEALRRFECLSLSGLPYDPEGHCVGDLATSTLKLYKLLKFIVMTDILKRDADERDSW
jgi:hypothetical protein